ncbi:NIPA-like protein 2 isoform X2 [Spea bombifrons]|uniref:NIPA-like protein 2 isoform X2 n=1 Tax=Spea bombifrons TaxID=233779 RepID=UPI00234A0296|nr:NIPA-like protein 2 isoform X2 [Spea bombifrons]
MANEGPMASLPENETFGHNSENNTGLFSLYNNTHQNQILGIILSIVGSFLISISLNLQKYTHLRLAIQQNPIPYYKSKLWWCGMVLMGIGELGNFAAYGFAPATLIAPLGCVAVIGSAAISVVFLKESLRASDVIGGTLAIAGTYLLVTFSPNVSQEVTAVKVQKYLVSWQFLIYLILEIVIFCTLLYFYKRKGVDHIVVLLLLVALLASMAVISVKAVSGMITETFKGKMQLTYPIFYVMFVVMVASCAFQVKFLNQAMQLYNATEVVPINFVFFTTSAIFAGVIFYQEFQDTTVFNVFMFIFGCLLSFLGVFLIARNQEKQPLQEPFINFGDIPGKETVDKIQPNLNSISYGTLPN